ncbi:MAG TPA: hypothetical protein VFP34_08510 [Microlunatus sp.]|nr:hypothetical protein [Microlunatus sp.]
MQTIDSLEAGLSTVLETVEDAVNFVVKLLAKFGATVARVVAFVKSVFNWTDIKMAQRVTEAALSQLPAAATYALRAMESSATARLTDLQTVIGTHFDGWIAALGTQSFNDGATPAKRQPPQDSQSKYVASMYADNIGAATGAANPTLSGPLSLADLTLFQSQLPVDSLPALQAAAASSQLSSYLASAESFLDAALSHLLAGLQTLVVDVIGLVRSAVEAVFDVIVDIIQAVFELCMQPISIPFLTDFYEQVIFSGSGERLTLLSLTSLVTAVPFTVACRLAGSQPGPVFTAGDLAAVGDPGWAGYVALRSEIDQVSGPATSSEITKRSADAGSVLESLVCDCLAGFAYSVSTLGWGIACYTEDILPVNDVSPDPMTPKPVWWRSSPSSCWPMCAACPRSRCPSVPRV